MAQHRDDDPAYADGAGDHPPLVGAHAHHGIPGDALKMGFDRNTEEGALIAMAGSLNPAKLSHRAVAWVLLLAFASPAVISVWHVVF